MGIVKFRFLAYKVPVRSSFANICNVSKAADRYLAFQH